MFNLATTCARAEEGRISLELPAADLEEKKPKVKDVKRKGLPCLQQNQTRSATGTSQSHPRVADSAPTTTSTPTTPTNAKSSGLCEMGISADALSATTGAMAEEEEEVVDDGKTVALAKGGETDLARIAGRTSLAREAREISLVRIALRAMQASLLCHHHRGGMKTIIRTKGLGASRSPARLPASWAGRKPQPLSSSSSSSPAK